MRGTTTAALAGAAALALAAGGGIASAAIGDLDPTFAGDGVANTDLGGADGARGVAIQSDGRIVVAGTGGGAGNLAVTRYLKTGALDASFSGDGIATLDLGTATPEIANAVQIASDGKIVVAGATAAPGGDLAVARFNADGGVDTSFSGDGFDLQDFGGDDAAWDVDVAGDNSVVIAGVAKAGPNSDFAIVRYLPTGVPSTGYSVDGRDTIDFSGADEARSVVLQDNGKVVAAGSSGGDLAIARTAAAGGLDATYAGDGTQTTNLAYTEGIAAIELDGKARTLFAATAGDAQTSRFVLGRYSSKGVLDLTFSGDGLQADVPLPKPGDEVRGLATQVDGRILLVAASLAVPPAPDKTATAGTIELARFNKSGTVDTSFGTAGRVTTAVGEGEDVAVGGDGRIVVAASTYPLSADLGTPDLAVARYVGMTCGGVPTTLVGDNGVNNLKGTKRADVVALLGDRDYFRARAKNDVVCGGDGVDTLMGGKGKDKLIGGKGADKLFGGKGKDKIKGGKGKDYVRK